MNTTLHNATAEYLEAVREALADQPADELAEIIDDVTEHLEQITVELGGDPSQDALQHRLGTPVEYAAELRTAAGLPGPDAPARTPSARRSAVLRVVVTWSLRLGVAFAVFGTFAMLADGDPNQAAGAYVFGLVPCAVGVALWLLTHRSSSPVAALHELPDAHRLEDGVAALKSRSWSLAAVEFIASLRPAWWLLRAWLATQALMWLADIDSVFPSDPGATASPVALVILIGAIIASVWWGRRAVAGFPEGWPRRLSSVGNVALALAAPLIILLLVSDEPEVYFEEGPQFEGIFHSDGSEITNIYVYNQDGQLLEGVRIYDQDGRPVENVAPWKWDECLELGGRYPGGPQGNVFPRLGVYHDDVGERCVDPGVAAPFGDSLPGSAAESDQPGKSGEPRTNGEPDVTSTTSPDTDDGR